MKQSHAPVATVLPSRFNSQKTPRNKQIGGDRISSKSNHLCNSKTGHPVVVACQYTWKKRKFNFGLKFNSAEKICCDCKLCLGLNPSVCNYVEFAIFTSDKNNVKLSNKKSSTCPLSPHAVPYIAVEVIISCARGSGVRQMIEEIKILSLDFPGFWSVIDHVTYC